MLFSEKWLRNHPQILLHFLIHIDVLILCRKFELILSSNSGVMGTKSSKSPKLQLLDECKTLRGRA